MKSAITGVVRPHPNLTDGCQIKQWATSIRKWIFAEMVNCKTKKKFFFEIMKNVWRFIVKYPFGMREREREMIFKLGIVREKWWSGNCQIIWGLGEGRNIKLCTNFVCQVGLTRYRSVLTCYSGSRLVNLTWPATGVGSFKLTPSDQGSLSGSCMLTRARFNATRPVCHAYMPRLLLQLNLLNWEESDL